MGYYADLIKEKRNAKTVNFLGQTYTFGEDKRKNSEIWQKLMRDGSNAREKAQDEYKRATREASEKYRKIDSDIGRQIDSLYSQLKEVLNSKEEKDNESKSQIEKRIKDAEERVKLFQRLEKEVQAKLEEGDEDDESRLRRQRESYRDGIANNQSLIEHLKKELKTAKNEKDNDSEGRLMEIAEKVLREYPESTKSYAKFEDRFLTKAGWSYNPSKVRTIKEIWERVANSKEEKDNEDPQIATLRRKALQKIKEAQKKTDWYGDTVMQKFEKDLTYAEEEDVPELAGALDRYLPKFEAKVKSFGNSNEEKGYYAKLAEEKASRKN